MLKSLRKYSRDETAQKRMEMIALYNQFGEKATIQAFGADRRVISRWKQRLARSGGKLTSLIPVSTKPKRMRMPHTHPALVAFIKKERETHPRIGKEKLKLDMDIYCEKQGIPTVSTSTIGNIIKRHKFFFQKSGKVYHNPNGKWARNEAKKTKRLRIRYSPKPT